MYSLIIIIIIINILLLLKPGMIWMIGFSFLGEGMEGVGGVKGRHSVPFA